VRTSPDLLEFSAIVVVLITMPCANFVHVLARSITQGRRAGLLAVLGLGAGVMLHTMLAVIGVAALIRASYVAFQIVRFGGSLYLIYLGFAAWCRPLILKRDRLQRSASDWRILWQSVITSMTNPPTMVFFVVALPQCVDRASSHVARQRFFFGGIYMVLTIIVYGLVAYSAGQIGHWLRSHKWAGERIQRVTGGSFVAVGVVALVDGG
jgi:threonine/homoserine/homoserine lactone efflux protein